MARCDLSTRYDPSHRAFAAITRVTLENFPSKVRAAKISKTTPCKVTGHRRPEKQLDLSGKSPALLHHSEML
jgi:hypothetical protein